MTLLFIKNLMKTLKENAEMIIEEDKSEKEDYGYNNRH
jgi:hypothetical protein